MRGAYGVGGVEWRRGGEAREGGRGGGNPTRRSLAGMGQ